MTNHWDADLDLARRLADAADAISMSYYRSHDLVIETKPDLTPVTEADKAVEQGLREILAAERPGDGILGEEFGVSGSTERTWILDPIDGTKNYLRGVPVWSTLIALRVAGVLEVGFVSAPALGRRWWAASGQGAWSTGPGMSEPTRIHVSKVAKLADASFSFSDSVGWAERGAAKGLDTLTSDTWRHRAYGDFWSHMLVAEGAVDIAGEPELATYDMAALIPVIREAGGMATGFDGSDPIEFGGLVSTNGPLHAEVLSALRS